MTDEAFTLCNGANCPLRSQCLRHSEFVSHPDRDELFPSPPYCDHGCELFIPTTRKRVQLRKPANGLNVADYANTSISYSIKMSDDG